MSAAPEMQARPLALITGASSGIGAVFAQKLTGRGYDLILVARRRDRLEHLARELESQGARAEVLVADLTQDEDMQRVEERISATDLDLLVNNAGFGTLGYFFETDRATQDQMHRLHVLAPMRLTHAALTAMVPRKKGAVISVSSVAAFASSPGNVSYCSTKRWINGFTEGLYLELKMRRSPVKVQALCPGFTYSEFHDTMGVDRNRIRPASLWMDAGFVVECSLEALERNQLFVIPGWRYKAIVTILGLLPQSIQHSVLINSARRMGRDLDVRGKLKQQ